MGSKTVEVVFLLFYPKLIVFFIVGRSLAGFEGVPTTHSRHINLSLLAVVAVLHRKPLFVEATVLRLQLAIEGGCVVATVQRVSGNFVAATFFKRFDCFFDLCHRISLNELLLGTRHKSFHRATLLRYGIQ